MKQMSKQELQCFLEFAPHYFRYVNKALDEQVCDHVTRYHYKCQAHTWNTYPLTPQPIRFNLQPFTPKFSLRRKEKSLTLLSNFLEVMGSFLEKRHGKEPIIRLLTWPNAQSNGNVAQKFAANIWTLPFNFFTRTRRKGMDNIKCEGSQHQRRGCVQWGIQGADHTLIFWPNWGPKGGKSIFFWDRILPPPPPPCLSQSLNDRATPLSEGLDRPLV